LNREEKTLPAFHELLAIVPFDFADQKEQPEHGIDSRARSRRRIEKAQAGFNDTSSEYRWKT